MAVLDNAGFLHLYKNKLINLKEDHKKLDWVNERQMMCRFEMAEKIIDFSRVNSWMDVGCGTGDFFQYILNKHPIKKVVGFDATAEFINISTKKNSKYNIDYIIANFLTFNHQEKYDLVTFSGILQCLNIDQQQIIFTLLSQWVTDDGQLWLDTLNYDYKNNEKRRINSLWRFKDTELKNYLEKCNFRNIECFAFNEKPEKTKSAECFHLYLYGIKNSNSLSNKTVEQIKTAQLTTPTKSNNLIKIPPQLHNLQKLSLEDQNTFLAAAESGNQTSWLYFFPFLFSFSQGKTQTLLWEIIHGSLCIYFLRKHDDNLRLSLFLPPYPYNADALNVAAEKVISFNGEGPCRILWAEEAQRLQLEKEGFTVELLEEEYIYDTRLVSEASGKHFERVRREANRFRRMPDFETREYRAADKEACLALLTKWRHILEDEKGIAIQGYQYTKTNFEHALSFKNDLLKNQVMLIDRKICAFTFGGRITSTHGSIFITISDHTFEGLGYIQRQNFLIANQELPFFNDSSDAGRKGISYVKEAFRPVTKNKLYKARRG